MSALIQYIIEQLKKKEKNYELPIEAVVEDYGGDTGAHSYLEIDWEQLQKDMEDFEREFNE